MEYRCSGSLPMLVRLCQVPAGTKIAKPSSAGWWVVSLFRELPICTIPWPFSMRRNWSVSG